MSSRQWNKLAERLAPTHRVIAPDFIGSGAEPRWPLEQRFHFRLDVERIVERIRALDEPVHLVGHSYGGFVALQVAQQIPAHIRTLAAYDPVAFGVIRAAHDAIGLADLQRAETSDVFNDIEHGGDDAWFDVFVDYWNGPGSWRAMPQPAREAFLAVGRKVFWEVHSLMHDQTPVEAYANLTAPALFLTGEKTPAAAQRVVALLAASLPNARAISIPGAGHMGPLTHHKLVNDALAAHV